MIVYDISSLFYWLHLWTIDNHENRAPLITSVRANKSKARCIYKRDII